MTPAAVVIEPSTAGPMATGSIEALDAVTMPPSAVWPVAPDWLKAATSAGREAAVCRSSAQRC
jgi:hypothetical protein